jgi:hypothetical protein
MAYLVADIHSMTIAASRTRSFSGGEKQPANLDPRTGT